MQRFISNLVRQSSTSVGYSIVVMIINIFFRFSTNRLRRREVTAALHGLSHHSLHSKQSPVRYDFSVELCVRYTYNTPFFLTPIFWSSVLRISYLGLFGITDWSMVFSMEKTKDIIFFMYSMCPSNSSLSTLHWVGAVGVIANRDQPSCIIFHWSWHIWELISGPSTYPHHATNRDTSTSPPSQVVHTLPSY